MQSILATIIAAILSIFGGHQAVTHYASNAAAAAAAFATTTQEAVTTTPPTAATHVAAAAPATTIAQVGTAVAPQLNVPDYVTHTELNAQLQGLQNSLQQFVSQTAAAPTVSGPGTPLAVEHFAPSQRIDNLANVTISNATVSGVSGLTAADIPSLSYLPLSGGTLTGTLYVPSLSASSTSYGSFTATNATTTNATTTNFFATNASTSNATSTNFFATIGHFTTGIIDSLTATVATITNLIATTITGTNATFTNATTTNATSTNFFATNSIVTNATITNLAVSGTGYFAGNVGIGTTSPQGALDVAGSIYGRDVFSNWSTPVGIVSINPRDILTNNPKNPVGGYATEVSYLLDGNQLNAWYRDTTNNNLYYAYSTDPLNNVWTIGNGGNPITVGSNLSYFNYVFKVGSTYYMAISGNDSNLYLYASTDKVTWTAQNGGSPILTHSSTATDWYYHTYNPAIAVNGSTWYLLIEGKSNTSSYQTGFSYGTFSGGNINFNTNLSATAVITGSAGNPDLIYVPDRNALLTLYGSLNNTGISNGTWEVRASTASLSNNLGLAASWIPSPSFALIDQDVHLTDPELVFNTGNYFLWKTLLGYNYNQSTGYQAYGQTTLDQLYDVVASTGTNIVTNLSLTDKLAIGTSTPNAYVDIENGVSAIPGLKVAATWGTISSENNITTALSLFPKSGVSSALAIFRPNSTATIALAVGIGASNETIFNTANAPYFFNTSGTTRFYIGSPGNVGIGTTSPDTLLSVGSATPVGNVAHFENSTGSCYINPTTTSLSCSSDARLKNNINLLTASSGIAALMQLNPVTFNWNSEATGTPTHGGFIAQQVLPILPDLVSQGPDGYYTLNYAGLTPYLVKAIQQLDQQLTDLANTLANFADSFTTKELIFTRATGDEIDVQRLCIGSTCVTEDQLKSVLAGTNVVSGSTPPSSSSSSATTTPDTTPPVITLNGDNPATIQVGDSYADLGATVTDSVDKNLGLKYFLNGALVSNITVDTSAAATDTIDYVATDNAGNTATSTRTVIIDAPSFSIQSPPPADTTATTTDATSTAQ